MKSIVDILNAFEKCLKQYGPAVHYNLRKGLSSSYVDEVLNKLGIRNDGIKTLYQWKDGIRHDTSKFVGEFDFCSHGKMIPLEEAVVHYETYIKENLWEKKFFPLFTNHAGDYLIYDTDVESGTYSMFFLYSPSLLIVEPETVYDNLESLFETIIICYQEGVYRFSESSNTLVIDHDEEAKISSKKNPMSDYWKN